MGLINLLSDRGQSEAETSSGIRAFDGKKSIRNFTDTSPPQSISAAKPTSIRIGDPAEEVITTVPLENTSTNTRGLTGSCDWSLPPSFMALLTAPFSQTIEELVPLVPAQVPRYKPAPDAAAPFMTALLKTPNARTDNGATAYTSTNSELVDLFFEFTPGVGAERLYELLDKAWAVDAVS
jgi:hypothetical protein